MRLKTYQENAIDDLLTKTKKLLGYSGGKKLIFKSPTGSGKTIMVAEFLKRLVDDKDVKQSLGFIWAAPHKLHIQSKDKLERYYETSRTLECSYFEDLSDRKINENEILFFNWESINKANAIYIKDNEQEFNLSKVLERSKGEGRKIILIIDESHFAAGLSDKKEEQAANKLRKDINADLIIEVSATPILKDPDETVAVQIEDVKSEGMIKKAVILNDGFNKIIKNGEIHTEKLSDVKIKDSEELTIAAAMRKRDEIVGAYKKEGVDINPLILIQLPRRVGQTEDRTQEKIERILKDRFKVSTKKGNNKLAIWLSEEKVNREDIERNDSAVEVLLFKEAIAYGWDCPRAQILILFREWHSPIFSIQTVGRIMRMPEPDKGHYNSEILNYGYVYTNLDHVDIKEDVAKGYITVYISRRTPSYRPINLRSCHPERHREQTRLSPLFTEMFLEEAKKYGLKKKIDIKSRKIDIKIISDYKSEDVDTLVGTHIVGDRTVRITGFDLQKLLDYWVRNNLTPIYPEDRSVNRVKQSIYTFFEREFKWNWSDKWEEIVEIILSEKNYQHFVNVLDKTKERYQAQVVKRENELIYTNNWNIREAYPFGDSHEEEKRKKSILQPFYVQYNSDLEKAFIDFLEKSSNVEWWFKNGDRDSIFFAVPYKNGEEKPFYVDFIVKLKNGKIGLFDPHGMHLGDFGAKAIGLSRYIRDENKKGKKLFGGLVDNTDRNYRGRWRYFDTKWNDLVF